jgi:molybdate transport system substrate-binding protein
LFVGALIGCCGGAVAGAPRSDELSGKVLVFAAASTTDALDEIRAEFERLHPAVKVRMSFAASSALAQQIRAGAPADVFLSASHQWADAVGELVARRRDLLGNTLVVVVPVKSSLRIERPEALAGAGVRRLAIADPRAVPAGIYARQALEKLGLWKTLQPRLAGGADVRQALKFVETGAADAGIVYSTDAATARKVRIAMSLDAGLTEPIRYPLVLLKQAEGNAAAAAFYEFLTLEPARAVFERHGFLVLGRVAEVREESPCGR